MYIIEVGFNGEDVIACFPCNDCNLVGDVEVANLVPKSFLFGALGCFGRNRSLGDGQHYFIYTINSEAPPWSESPNHVVPQFVAA